MRSEKDVLPGEDAALYEQRRAAFHRDLAPRDAVQQALVDRFARLEWRGQRGEAVEEARAELKIHDVVENAARRDAAEAARLAASLNESPENLPLLLGTPAGVRLAIQEWSILRADAVQYNNLLSTQRHRCLALVGKRRGDALRGDPVALHWVRVQLGFAYGETATLEQVANRLGDKPREGMSGAEFDIRVERMARALPSKKEAHALLLGSIDEEVRRLEELLEELEPLAEQNLALAAEAARMEVTAEGSRLGQQILASYRGSDACLRRLEALKNPRQPGPGRGSRQDESAPAPPAAAPAPQDTPSAASSDDAAGDGDRPAGDAAPSASATAAPDTDEASAAPRADEAILIVADDATAAVACACPAPEPHAPAPPPTTTTTTTGAPAPDTDEAVLAGEPSPSPAAGAVVLPPRSSSTPPAPETTTDDIPIPEPTEEELQRYCPEVVAFQRLHQTLEATYGTGTRRTAGEPAPCPPPAAAAVSPVGPGSRSAPEPRSHPPGASGADTVEAILGRAPPSDP